MHTNCTQHGENGGDIGPKAVPWLRVAVIRDLLEICRQEGRPPTEQEAAAIMKAASDLADAIDAGG